MNFDSVSWLQLFRVPTLPVFLLLVMAGFLAGGGKLFSLTGVAFFAWAWLAHHVTFAHNSLADFLSGHDLEKSPTTRPLVRGSISPESARKVIYPGLALVAIFGAFLSLSGGGHASFSLASLLLFYALGLAYNGLSKVTNWSFLFISLAFACLPAFSYFAVAGAAGISLAVIMAFVALTICFETAWGGQFEGYQDGRRECVAGSRRDFIQRGLENTFSCQGFCVGSETFRFRSRNLWNTLACSHSLHGTCLEHS